MRIRTVLVTAALALALTAAPALTATAATAPSVLDALCGHHSAGKPCTVLVQRESGQEVLKVRDPAGQIHRFTSSVTAWRYIAPRTPSCRIVTSGNACHGTRGGDRYIVIGHGTTHDRSLPQYGHGVLVYLGDLD